MSYKSRTLKKYHFNKKPVYDDGSYFGYINQLLVFSSNWKNDQGETLGALFEITFNEKDKLDEGEIKTKLDEAYVKMFQSPVDMVVGGKPRPQQMIVNYNEILEEAQIADPETTKKEI